jgi:serine/threonine-protein kinase RsbW
MLDGDFFTLSLPSQPQSVPLARRALVDFARRCGLSGERLQDVGLAVSEAITNVVLHANEGHRP